MKVLHTEQAADEAEGALSPERQAELSLTQAAAAGDREAAAAVLMRFLPRVRNLVRYLVPGDAEVADITQEAMIALVQSLKNFRGSGPLNAFADTIVRRTTFAELRKRRLANPVVSIEALLATTPGADHYAESRRLVTQLDALPLEQRHALVLHHVLELTVPEIAEELSLPIETVRSRLRLGREKLKKLAGGGNGP